jgi:spermidine/putrescine transport system permease protein
VSAQAGVAIPCSGAGEKLRLPVRLRMKRAAPGWGGAGIAIFILLALYGPITVLAIFSFNDSIVLSLPWAGFTTRWYHEALGNANLQAALRNSFLVACVVAPLSLGLGTLGAFCITRMRFWGRGPTAMLLAAPLVVPWLIVGVSAVIFFSRLNVGLSWRTVIAVQTVVTFPLVTVIVSARLARFDRTQEEAAVDLGASQLQVLRHVVLPHLVPALAASAILAFMWSFNNFEISYFVGGFDELFPVWVYSTLRHASNLPVVNAIASLVAATEVIVVYLAYRAMTWRSGARTAREKADTITGAWR